MFDLPNTLAALLIFVVIASIYAMLFYRPKSKTRVERKLAKLASPQPTVVVIHGGPRMAGRPRMMDVREAVADLNDQRPTVKTVNTVLRRRGLSRSSDRLVRSLLRRLVKRHLVIRLPKYPGAPSHQQVYSYAAAR